MRDLAPHILADAFGEGGHAMFILPTELSTPMFDPQATIEADNGVEKLTQFLLAFKLAIRAMGAQGSVSWRQDAKGNGGQFWFQPFE